MGITMGIELGIEQPIKRAVVSLESAERSVEILERRKKLEFV